MNIANSLDIAASGISAVNNQLAIVSNNIANQSTAAYATEVANQSALIAGGTGMGVVSTATTRDINLSLQSAVYSQNATVASLTTQSTALSTIDSVSGTTGANNDLSSLLSKLQTAFTTLSSSPDSTADQTAVVSAASTLASGINNIATTITAQRQTAQDNIVTSVNSLNAALAQIGKLNTQIETNQAAGASTADLENERDISEQTISSLVGVKFVTASNGGVQVITNSGTTLPTDGTSITTSSANLSASSTYPSDIPAITLNGADITSALSGGAIGANITLRDTTLPARQAELDEFSEQIAARFSAQGLDLFTDGSGKVPTTGSPTQANYVGFSSTIQVNSSVGSNVSLVRDGTQNITGSSSGASAFTTNSAGTSGFTTLINRVLDYTFGANAQDGVAQAGIPTSGLGSDGGISLGYATGSTLGSYISAFSANDATETSNASSQLSSETATQTTLKNQLSSGSAVSVDDQMSSMVKLQNAYAANAKVLTAIQSMWTALINAVS